MVSTNPSVEVEKAQTIYLQSIKFIWLAEPPENICISDPFQGKCGPLLSGVPLHWVTYT